MYFRRLVGGPESGPVEERVRGLPGVRVGRRGELACAAMAFEQSEQVGRW